MKDLVGDHKDIIMCSWDDPKMKKQRIERREAVDLGHQNHVFMWVFAVIKLAFEM